jgi:hypothetical protein
MFRTRHFLLLYCKEQEEEEQQRVKKKVNFKLCDFVPALNRNVAFSSPLNFEIC